MYQNKKNKMVYQAPEVELMECKVERGFEISNNPTDGQLEGYSVVGDYSEDFD